MIILIASLLKSKAVDIRTLSPIFNNFYVLIENSWENKSTFYSMYMFINFKAIKNATTKCLARLWISKKLYFNLISEPVGVAAWWANEHLAIHKVTWPRGMKIGIGSRRWWLKKRKSTSAFLDLARPCWANRCEQCRNTLIERFNVLNSI